MESQSPGNFVAATQFNIAAARKYCRARARWYIPNLVRMENKHVIEKPQLCIP